MLDSKYTEQLGCFISSTFSSFVVVLRVLYKSHPTTPTTTNNTSHYCLCTLRYFCSWFPSGNIARSTIKTRFYFSRREIIRDIWLLFCWIILSSFDAFTFRLVNVTIFAVFINILIQ